MDLWVRLGGPDRVGSQVEADRDDHVELLVNELLDVRLVLGGVLRDDRGRSRGAERRGGVLGALEAVLVVALVVQGADIGHYADLERRRRGRRGRAGRLGRGDRSRDGRGRGRRDRWSGGGRAAARGRDDRERRGEQTEPGSACDHELLLARTEPRTRPGRRDRPVRPGGLLRCILPSARWPGKTPRIAASARLKNRVVTGRVRVDRARGRPDIPRLALGT